VLLAYKFVAIFRCGEGKWKVGSGERLWGRREGGEWITGKGLQAVSEKFGREVSCDALLLNCRFVLHS
jgi:hypothetical protein